MSNKLQKPYEISIWEDILVEEENKSYYKEVKIATIGSDKMTSWSKINNIVFTQNVNGEITLTFDIIHRYYDDSLEGYTINPFERYLINERKVKLFYDEEWYDFIIKTCEENSDSNTFTYTATGLFANELGKVGYNIVLSSDLRNNQGTIFELGEKAVKGTDWIIDKENSDIIRQYVAEPLYTYKNNVAFNATELIADEEVNIEANETLYLFYSTIANSQSENVFFLREEDFEDSFLDDNNVAQMPNYRFSGEANYNSAPATVVIGDVTLTLQTADGNSTGINYRYQGYRLAYSQLTGYDTIKDRPVTIYEAEYENGSKDKIYKYTDYEYVTSDVVTNFVTNGSSFNIYQDGSLEGWSSATPTNKAAFSRSVSDLKIGDDLGEVFSLTGIQQFFIDSHIKFQPVTLSEDIIKTYSYNIQTKRGGIQIVYSWDSRYDKTGAEHSPDTLVVTITNGTAINTYNRNSDNSYADIADVNISNIGTIINFVTPNDLTSKETFLSILDEHTIFTTSAANGKYFLQPLELITYPAVTVSSIINLSKLNGIKGYLRTQFKGTSSKADHYINSIFNSGIGEHRDQIKSFSQGEEYVFRIAYGLTDEDGGRPQITSEQAGKIKAVVAKYTMEPQVIYDTETKQEDQVYLYTPDVNEILFEFNGPFELKNNVITGGYFKTNDEGEYITYYKDGVSLTPSVDYIYEEAVEGGNSITKVYDSSTGTFVDSENNNNFLDYYYTTAICKKAISNTALADTADDYGIFLYIDDNNFISTEEHPNYFCIKDVQIFKKKLDGDEDIVLIGNTPKATAIQTDFFYLQPEEDTEEDSIETFNSIEAIADFLGLDPDNDIKPLYNEDYEKISSIEISQSNCFNIIQDLCEAFECWARFNIDHDETGAIRLNSDGAPSKKISFHKYSGDNNYAGFKYGINLESIQRTLESDEFVSKLIVEQVENDVVDGGVVSIATAPSNPSGESYIINMSYYLNQGLIENPKQYYLDYNNFVEQLKAINAEYTYNKTQWQLASLARTKANSNVNVYHELVEEAEKDYTEALFNFKELTGLEYSDYLAGNGYSINFTLVGSGDSAQLYGVFSNFIEYIDVTFFDSEGNTIIIGEKNTKKGIETTTKEYEVEEIDAEEHTLADVKYIAIENDIGELEVLNADESYSTLIDYFPVEKDIIYTMPKYVWYFGTNDRPTNITINIVPSNDNETLTDIVGRIYTDQQTINDYKPLLEMAKAEKSDLDITINGTKDYTLNVSTVSNTVGGVEFKVTKEVLDDYIEGLFFTLSNQSGTWNVNTTVTEKSFSQDNVYDTIAFRQYPRNYQLKYTDGDNTYITSEPIVINIPLNGKKAFTLVPIVEKKGIKDTMQELLDQKEEIEAIFYKKYSRFIQEGSWSSSDYIDNELYYLDALKVSTTSAQPKVSYDLAVQEISEQPGFENYNFKIGDKTYIEDTQFFGYHTDVIENTAIFEVIDGVVYLPENTFKVLRVYRDLDHAIRNYKYNPNTNEITFFTSEVLPDDPPVENGEELYVEYYWKLLTPVKEEVIVSEVEWHLDDASENVIKIQNYKTQFDDLFQRMAAAVQSVEYNTASYARAASILTENGTIDANLLLKSLSELSQGFAFGDNDALSISEDGLVVKDLLDPMRQLKVAGGGLKTSLDGGYNWDTVITAEGLVIDSIDTQNVLIKDGKNPSFRWDKYGLNAYGFNSNSTDLKTYVRYDKYGLYGVLDGKDFKAQSLEDIKRTAQFGLLWDGFFIKNSYTDGYVSISSDNDFQVVANDQERIKIGVINETSNGYEYGIRIKNAYGENVFVTDDSGNIEMSGIVNAKGGTFTDMVSVGAGTDSIILKGTDTEAIIGSSSYFDDHSRGWAIKSDGDAIFNNITARGAIRTAVFEYSEIEAVGGIFVFRPSSTIRTAQIPIVGVAPGYTKTNDEAINNSITYYTYDEQTDTYTPVDSPVQQDLDQYYIYNAENDSPVYGDDLLLTVEKPLLFSVGDWCKVSNYDSNDPNSALAAGGLVNIFEISDITNNVLTLANGAEMFADLINTTVIDNDYIYATGSNNIYSLRDVNNPQPPYAMENLTEKYFYDILIIEDIENFSESEDESEDTIDESFAEGVPQTLMFTDNTGAVYSVTFIGNLSLWNNNEENNTGETYLFITLNNQTYLYVGEGNEYYNNNVDINFLIKKKQELDYGVNSLVGGALISFGNYRTSLPVPEISHNYGIGINSSDSSVNLPARAISLFETEIYPDENIKVGYKFRGILGTLPELPATSVNTDIYDNMRGTQGIYTDNMYLGDLQQYLAFYTDKDTGEKKLKISAAEISFEIPDEHGQGSGHYQNVADIEAEGVPGPPGDDAVIVKIDSTAGNFFRMGNVSTSLIAHVYKGTTDITSQVLSFDWYRRLPNGDRDTTWVSPSTSNLLPLTPSDVDEKAVFVCEVMF